MFTDRLNCSLSQIILHENNTGKYDLIYHKQRIINKLFRLESSDHSLQLRELKNEIKFLISQQSLPFKIFYSIFPKLAEITESKEKINLVFELFRQFAENPSTEICGRFYWFYYQGKYLEEYKAKKCFLDITKCLVTRDALFSSIFGIHDLEKIQRLTVQMADEVNFKKAWSKIEENSFLLKIQPGLFIAYSFGMPRHHEYSPFPGHIFIVIQYLNEHDKIQYQIFQSFLEKFCLKDYLKKIIIN